MNDAHALKAPSALLLALEGRAPWELGAAIATYPLLRLAARGDGHPVVVFPGLAASDMSTLPLRAFLREHGYRPRAAGKGASTSARAPACSSAASTW